MRVVVDTNVFVSAALKTETQRDKRAMATEDLPEWLVDQIAVSEMDPRFAYLDETE
jgi:predicted nucleic acid-binding protein